MCFLRAENGRALNKTRVRRISSFAPVWKVGTHAIRIEGKISSSLSLDKKEIKFAPLKSDRSESFVGGGLDARRAA
jgi:hypothetical protein